MSTPLRTLLIEDSEIDAVLLVNRLRQDGFEPAFQCVRTAAEMGAALTAQEWDVVLCDNTMPGFDAMSALQLLNETGLTVPFIIVSGTINEETAVAAMKLGAADYLLKDRLTRLGVAVSQALEQGRQSQERKKAEAALRESDARLRMFSENSPTMIFIKDAGGRYRQVNRLFEQMFRLTQAEVVGKTDMEIFPPEQAAAFQANDRKVLQTGAAQEFEERADYFDGPHISIVSKFPLRDAAGRITGVCGIATDITERKRAEEKLRTEQATVQTIFDSAPVAILSLDLQGRITKWNAGAARLFGWDEAEVLGSVCPTVPTDGMDDFFAMVQRVARQGPDTGMIYPRQKKNGERIHASINAAPLRNPAGNAVGVMVILEDVTQRLRTQEALQRSASEQRQLAEQLAAEKARLIAAQAVAKVGSWETDLATGTVTWSDETHRIFETDPATFPPTHPAFLQLVHPDDRALVDEAFIRSLGVRSPCAIEHRLQMPDGRIKTAEERWQVFLDDNGQPLRAVGTCQDITARKRAEDELRESDARLFKAFHSSPVGVGIQRWSDRKFVEVNAAFTQLTRWARDELIGHTIVERQLAEPAALRKLLEQFGANRVLRDAEVVIKTRDGEIRHVLMGVEFIELHGEPHTVSTFFDITERKRAEAELRAAEQQLHALVGRLHTVREEEAKRIARELHDDLGQKLTALNMELSDLEEKLPGASAHQRTQIARMHAVVDQTIEVVQKISGELRLGQLDMLGLTAAIDWHMKEFSRSSGMRCRILRLDEIGHLSDAQSTAVFRILQEALTNVVRHAAATEVDVSLQSAPDQLTLTVHDNGRGLALLPH